MSISVMLLLLHTHAKHVHLKPHRLLSFFPSFLGPSLPAATHAAACPLWRGDWLGQPTSHLQRGQCAPTKCAE